MALRIVAVFSRVQSDQARQTALHEMVAEEASQSALWWLIDRLVAPACISDR